MHDNKPDLFKPVTRENALKDMLINYVGEKLNPENDEVNVEMIIEVMAHEFPEFLLIVAEENFIRGYQQALTDVDTLENNAADAVKQ